MYVYINFWLGAYLGTIYYTVVEELSQAKPELLYNFNTRTTHTTQRKTQHPTF